MKKIFLLPALALLLIFGILTFCGCNKTLPLAPHPSGSVATIPTTTPSSSSVCLPFTAIMNFPFTSQTTGNFVIHSMAGWLAYTGCTPGTCPVPPVDFNSSMLLVSEETFTRVCGCFPLSEAITEVCTDGNVITVNVHKTFPPDCSFTPTASPGICVQSYTIGSAIALNQSGLPVTWVYDGL